MFYPAIDTACPECGHEGPHPMIGVEGPLAVIECADVGDCGAEFTEAIKGAS